MLPSNRRSLALRLMASALAVVISLMAPVVAGAQNYPYSQRGAVTQSVAFTDISVWYGRPVARGRVLFADSGLVKYGAIWHPGADSATRIMFNHDVLVEDKPLKAGEYSLWILPRNGASWTVILSSAAHVFHQPYPGAQHDVLRVDVAVQRVSHMESMAIYFPAVQRDSTVMRIHWGEVAVPIRIKAPYRPSPEQ